MHPIQLPFVMSPLTNHIYLLQEDILIYQFFDLQIQKYLPKYKCDKLGFVENEQFVISKDNVLIGSFGYLKENINAL